MKLHEAIRQAVKLRPDVKAYLSNYARYMLYEPAEYKTAEYMLRQIEGLVRSLYGGYIGGEFIDTMANVISGQLTQAFRQAYEDNGYTDYFAPDYLQAGLDAMILDQYNYVDGFFKDIVNARIDGTSIEPLLARARLWANQWTAAYNEAVRLMGIENGSRMIWTLGEAEHCTTCLNLNGIVAFASEWDAIGIKPQSDRLECHGFNCACSLEVTDKRRSPDAYGRIEEALL